MSPRRLLHLIGSVELATLALMLGNIATVHAPAISRVLGPVHGLAYTVTVLAAVLVMRGRHRVWLLALVPGIGGLLAGRAASPAPFAGDTDDLYV
ncbi:hypothetical protein [Myceligenerans pegani]|uniref:DUF3817 domain-containing protein n=1 Tax=Myceligenerans pegani TaxID=2776917 RepID=A0ABR9N3U3_9MICO|nr:hypothetical protein [Myceligenerans sp. TRM 65318]MBE1878330.1 hypothetical protein [Myceligenerans sp. TRM 65318]MBE3020601.1 hypothetical protein [Myceligenerans sp. TRM 65318]